MLCGRKKTSNGASRFLIGTKYTETMDIEKRKEQLSEKERRVLFEGGTEAPFSGELLHENRKGMFTCKVCGAPLFVSDAKFDSGTGWPSFDQSLPGAVEYVEDRSHGMSRVEVRCAVCHAHLGHMFDDLPAHAGQAGGLSRTGKRYCMNSVCLEFSADEQQDKI